MNEQLKIYVYRHKMFTQFSTDDSKNKVNFYSIYSQIETKRFPKEHEQRNIKVVKLKDIQDYSYPAINQSSEL